MLLKERELFTNEEQSRLLNSNRLGMLKDIRGTVERAFGSYGNCKAVCFFCTMLLETNPALMFEIR